MEGITITNNIVKLTNVKVERAQTQSGPITINGCLLKYKKQCMLPAILGNLHAKYYDENIATTSFVSFLGLFSMLERFVFFDGEDFFFSSFVGASISISSIVSNG